MTAMHTYHFPFRNGTFFKTNATELKYAVSNFFTYFSDVEINKRGGLDVVLPEEKKEAEAEEAKPKEVYYTAREICLFCDIPLHVLQRMVDCGCVDRVMRGKYTHDAIEDVKNCLDERRKNPHYYMERYATERRKRLWMTGR